jgi:hypothetical protein
MKLQKKIMALGLAGLLTIAACKGPKIEYAKLNEKIEYKQEAVIYNRIRDTHEQGLTARIIDLDGKQDANGKVTADEAFIFRGDEPLLSNVIFDAVSRPNSQIKHYVAPDAKNPVVLNNITPMTQEQRDFYSRILNMYHENVVKHK